MGALTGAAGGVLRDTLINEVPLIFRKDVYATACIAGGLIYWLALETGMSPAVQQISCAMTVIIVRLLAAKYKWQIPELAKQENEENNNNVRNE